MLTFLKCFIYIYVYRFNHGSCAEGCRLLPVHAVCVPCIVARGRGAPPDHQPAAGHKPGGRGPVPGPGRNQLLLHIRPQSYETPTLLRGNHCCHNMAVKCKITHYMAQIHRA